MSLASKGEARKKGKKGRKIGRCKRKPSNIRYTLEQRWKINKKKKQARHKKRVEKKLNK